MIFWDSAHNWYSDVHVITVTENVGMDIIIFFGVELF